MKNNNKMKANQGYDFDYVLEFTGKREEYNEKCNTATYRPTSTEINRPGEALTEMNKPVETIPKILFRKKKHRSAFNTLNKSFKNRNTSIEDFLNRTVDYQKKKNNDIAELKVLKNTKLMEEVQDRPMINPYAENLIYKPLYKRFKEEIDKKQVTIDNLKKMYINMGENSEDQPESKVNYSSRYLKPQTQKWVNEQAQNWTKKRQNVSQEKYDMNKQKEVKDCSFKPQISNKSKAITKNSSMDNKMTSYDRLYSHRNDRNEQVELTFKENTPSFKPILNNKSSYKNVMSKYKSDLTPKRDNKYHEKFACQKKKPWGAHRCISTEMIDHSIPMKKTKNVLEEDAREHWSVAIETINDKNKTAQLDNHLNAKSLTYKLNIRQVGAWNEVTENKVYFKNAKNIIGLILS